MTEVAIFSIGAVLFVITTWATIAFGLHRVHELQVQDLAGADLIPEAREDGLTEIYVPRDAAAAGSVRIEA